MLCCSFWKECHSPNLNQMITLIFIIENKFYNKLLVQLHILSLSSFSLAFITSIVILSFIACSYLHSKRVSCGSIFQDKIIILKEDGKYRAVLFNFKNSILLPPPSESMPLFINYYYLLILINYYNGVVKVQQIALAEHDRWHCASLLLSLFWPCSHNYHLLMKCIQANQILNNEKLI